jgi:hypothetical protein
VISASSNDIPEQAGAFGRMSTDGRYVLFSSASANLVDDGEVVGGSYLRDRISGITAKLPLWDPTGSYYNSAAVDISGDGLTVAIGVAPAYLSGNPYQTAIYEIDPSDVAGDLTGDGDRDDLPAMVFDTAGSSLTTLCGASSASVAAGRAAYLRPEQTAGNANCPAGSLNGDADTSDRVVQLWSGGPSAVNLHCPATALSLSSTWLAALVDECAQTGATPAGCAAGGTVLNADADAGDSVLMLHEVSAPAGACALPTSNETWKNIGQAATKVTMSGTAAVFLTDEAAQDAVLNGDGLQDDVVLQVAYAAAPAPASLLQAVNTGQAAEDFVVGAAAVATCGNVHLVAFHTSEAAQGVNLNSVSNGDPTHDDDLDDNVLQLYDLTTGTLVATGQAVLPCLLDACDPRQPYKVSGSVVKFLTLEVDQGRECPMCANGRDLDGHWAQSMLRFSMMAYTGYY